MELRGASALVTGAGRGIGRSVALCLARAGAAVTGVSRTGAELDALVNEIRKAGGRAHAHVGDLRDPAVCSAAVAAANAAHGRLSLLINNAGVGFHGPLESMSDEEWSNIFETNLGSIFRLTRAALPSLLAGGGHVVMISSLAGSNPIASMAAYCASKAALDHLSRCLMLEVRDRGVVVSVVAPGSVATSFGGTPRESPWMLSADDVARAVMDILEARSAAHLSRIEMRPSQPQKR